MRDELSLLEAQLTYKKRLEAMANELRQQRTVLQQKVAKLEQKMLSEKKVYSDIVAQTGASTATISRVNRSLQYGSNGYEVLFQRIEEKNE